MLAHSIVAGRLELARRQYRHCVLCEHRCGVDRTDGGRGPCMASDEARVYRHRVEYGEELQIVPSHLFYLSGCDLRCAFCVAEANGVAPRRGRPLTGEFLSEAVAWGQRQGGRNIQWVGGEPTIHLPAVLEAMAQCGGQCGQLPPVVWKSAFHGTPEAMELLDGVVDVYVADFKFGNDVCAERIAGVHDYLQTVTRNLLIAANQGDLIVRHLLLPGHFECCYRPIVDWMRRRLPLAKFSIRDGYLPCWHAGRHDELTEPLAPEVADRARSLAARYGLNLVT